MKRERKPHNEQAEIGSFAGRLIITVDRDAVCSVAIIPLESGDHPAPFTVNAAGGSPVLQEAINQLRDYCAGRLTVFKLPLRLIGTPFQQAVWQALGQIPFGAVTTYGEIAERLGSPGAARAVGQALRRNPLPIIVPCHRVIGAAGGLGGYTPDVAVKKLLLAHEGVAIPA